MGNRYQQQYFLLFFRIYSLSVYSVPLVRTRLGEEFGGLWEDLGLRSRARLAKD